MAAGKSHFDALRRVCHTFNATFDEQQLVQMIVDTSIELLDLKAASIYLIDEITNEIKPMYHKGLSGEYLRSGLTKPDILFPVLRKEGHLLVKDATQDSRLDNQEAKAREGIGSILIAPVKAADLIIGGISCYSSQPRDFSPEDIEFLVALGEQAGYAVEHSRLVQRLKENNQIFLDFTTAINTTFNLQKVLHVLAADIAEYLEVKGSSVLLFDEQREKLRFITGYGLSEEYTTRDRLVLEESVRQTLHGNTVFIKDVQTDERVKYKKSKQKEGIVSILSVPITAHGEVLGALRLYSGIQRQFSEHEIMLVQSLAQIGGIAIQNATMYTRLKDDMKDLEQDIWSHRLWF